MRISNLVLIEELKLLTLKAIESATQLSKEPLEKLQKKENPTTWSALECIEHLNRYGDFYLPEIKAVMLPDKQSAIEIFKAGLLGNYFANAMKVKPKLNKMKTFQNMNPNQCSLNKDVLVVFLKQQAEMLDLLNQAKTYNLTKLKTKISISKFIKLRLGDTFRVVVYHNERHLLQANRYFFS
ncbi:DinB family protein [Putridiphycobacter roseus]|uniref:DinB family protein n=1 Tax=Putridiphycobacter roseus TaxID=2219161 RepID=A0A2W1N3Q3_9FLAO|nr:DinB family protein [Putridiphycobacter roseus]PZE17671.1 DinB family protein [Putridiphycobacter roseus]